MLGRRLAASLVGAAVLLTPALAHAQSYVYDTRKMALDGSWTVSGVNVIGGFGYWEDLIDLQVADDFTILLPTRLTRVTLDLAQYAAGATPAGGFLVEVFPDTGIDSPEETPSFSFISSSFTFDGESGFGTGQRAIDVPEEGGTRSIWSVNVSGGNIVLAPGKWWISVVPVDITAGGTNFRWIGNAQTDVGARAFYRSGGNDHANGYPGGSGSISPENWSVNSAAARPKTLSMRIEGDITSGACCAPGNTCTVTAQADCATGTWHAGGACDPNPCSIAPPVGSCCAYSGHCAITLQDGCIGASWSFGGACNPTSCPPVPMGTCCTYQGECTFVIQTGCAGVDTLWSVGGTCTPNSCPPPPPGACCNPEGSTCEVTLRDACPPFAAWVSNGVCTPTAQCPPNFEVEPNNAVVDASVATLASGDTFSGIQMESVDPFDPTITGPDSRDMWRIRTTPAPLGIYRHRLTRLVGDRTVAQMGFQEDNGVMMPQERFITFDGPWFGFGKQESVLLLVMPYDNIAAGLYTYQLTTEPVTPVILPGTVSGGPVTITLLGGDSNGNIDADTWLYDANFNPIPGAGSDDTIQDNSAGPCVITRALAPGDYYLAVSFYDLVNDQLSPPGDFNRTGIVLDTPNVVSSENAWTSSDGFYELTIADADGATSDLTLFRVLTGYYEVGWIKFTVTGGAATENCCRGTTCNSIAAGSCTGTVAGSASIVVGSCGTGNATATCCYADFNHDGSPSIDDLFLYLNAYFTGSPWANVGGDGVEAPTIDDLFLYINAYFTGCA